MNELPRSKRKMLGIRIKPKEGLWITYRLRLMGLKKKDMAERLGVCPQTVEQIINGKRSSRRIEDALYQTLGYPSFEAMIAAARGKGETVSQPCLLDDEPSESFGGPLEGPADHDGGGE